MTSIEQKGSFNSEHKVLIREKWNQPLLKYLSNINNDRLIYMGLPSSKAEDIKTWIKYIKVVIAFQCRVYGEISDQSQSREEIKKLEKYSMSLERENLIDDYIVYDGYIEEVVLRGNDNSPHRIDFEQDSIVTLYNLDFCNKITSPKEYLDKKGDLQIAYKFNAINKLLRIQDSLSNILDKFIFFLTVHCSYDGEELNDFINSPPDNTIKEYIKKLLLSDKKSIDY